MLCSISSIPSAHAADSKPIVIFILADDMAPGDFASANDGLSRTPNLDRLAKESVNFVQAYSGSCVCAPARAALLTGRYPHRTGVVTLNMNRYPNLTRLRHDEITIAERLRENGYATGLVGKWHCGKGEEFSPLRHGFAEFEGFSGSQELSYFRYSLQVNESTVEVDDEYLTNDLSKRAIEFVQRHRSEPFFLHLAHYAPHRPLEAPPERVAFFKDKGLDESQATIYAMIEVMDRGIGDLMTELDRLNLSERTVVIFASDNGPDPITGERYNQNLKGMKYEVGEGGIRVPLLVRWPGRFQPASVAMPVHFVDLFPTILDMCGVEPPPNISIDGESFLQLLDGGARPSRRMFWQWNRGNPNYTHNAALREGRWKLVRPFITRKVNPEDSTESPRLFDLSADPFESRDLAREQPERVREMNRRLLEWTRSVEADRVRPKLKSKTQ